MVDVVVNNVMATSTSPDYSPYMFKDSVSWSTNRCLDANFALLVVVSSILSDTMGKRH
jgi:hypothetical protein